MLTNFSESQHEVLRSVLQLYMGGARTFDVDLTYGSGGFYKKGMPRPRLCFDQRPRFDFVEQVNSAESHARLGACSVDSIVYDPPYLHAPGKDSIMGQRFGGYKNYKERDEDYKATMESAHISLRRGGIFVFKCQDIVESGKQHFNHCKVWGWALEHGGWTVEDMLVTRSAGVIKGWNHSNQKHFRKEICFFWVLRKTGEKKQP